LKGEEFRVMDWNGNGKIDPSEILTTELFEEELERDRKLRYLQKEELDVRKEKQEGSLNLK
jgi:hypothetical protein